MQVGRAREAAEAFQRAADHYQERGNAMSAGAALRQAAHSLTNLGDPSGRDVLEESLRLLKSQAPSAELGLSLLTAAINQFNAGALEAAQIMVQEVEPLVTGNNPELSAQFHMERGATRSWLGDPGGLTEMEESIQLFIHADLAHRAAVAYYNLAEASRPMGGPEVTLHQLESGEEFCQARGLTTASSWLRTMRISCLAQVGRLREALAVADAILPAFEEAGDDQSVAEAASWKAFVLLEINGSADHIAEQALQAARRTEVTHLLALGQTAAALHCWAVGDAPQARSLLGELRDNTNIEKTPWAAIFHHVVRLAVGIEDLELAREFVSTIEATASAVPAHRHSLLTAKAVLAHAQGDYSTAVRLFTKAQHGWSELGNKLEYAHGLLGLAQTFREAGQDANQPLHRALVLFNTMGADHRAEQCKQLLGDVPTARSAV
jgi:tetratricopeptide (TPR) repeat protein